MEPTSESSTSKTMVRIGTFGEIKKTMKLLSKRDSHIDMEFICGENQDVLKAHRFIIGAQSRLVYKVTYSVGYFAMQKNSPGMPTSFETSTFFFRFKLHDAFFISKLNPLCLANLA